MAPLQSTERDEWYPAAQRLGELAFGDTEARRRIWEQARVNTLGMKFVEVPAGEFTMGPDTHRLFNLWVGHPVEITVNFFVSVTEVTNEQLKQVIPAFETDSKYSPDHESPAVGVSWEEAAQFCKLLSEREGSVYRLPTEAEWEYACRAGSSVRFCFGHEEARLSEYGWCEAHVGKASLVALLKPNAWGIYDMHGNVFEWVSDWYSESYYADSAAAGLVRDPQGPEKGSSHVLRSGTWFASNPVACTCTARFPMPLFKRRPFMLNDPPMTQLTGFRVVREFDRHREIERGTDVQP